MKSRIQLRYDDRCPVCARTACWVQTWDSSNQFELVSAWRCEDTADRDSAAPRELILIRPEGSQLGGWDAVCELLRHHPKLRVLGMLGSLPVIRLIGRMAYRGFARNRHRFSPKPLDT